MISIILIDRNNVIHDVFIASQLTDLEIEEIEQGAKNSFLTAIIRSATPVNSAEEILVEIAAINEASTAEIPSVPSVSGVKAVISIDPSIQETFLDLDWEELDLISDNKKM